MECIISHNQFQPLIIRKQPLIIPIYRWIFQDFPWIFHDINPSSDGLGSRHDGTPPLPSGLGHLGRVNHKLRLRQRSWCDQDIVTCTGPGIRLRRRPGAPHLRGSGEKKTDVCWMDGKIYAFYVDISCIYKSSICKFVRVSPFILSLYAWAVLDPKKGTISG